MTRKDLADIDTVFTVVLWYQDVLAQMPQAPPLLRRAAEEFDEVWDGGRLDEPPPPPLTPKAWPRVVAAAIRYHAIQDKLNAHEAELDALNDELNALNAEATEKPKQRKKKGKKAKASTS